MSMSKCARTGSSQAPQINPNIETHRKHPSLLDCAVIVVVRVVNSGTKSRTSYAVELMFDFLSQEGYPAWLISLAEKDIQTN